MSYGKTQQEQGQSIDWWAWRIIAELAEQRGLSIAEVARRAHLNRPQLSRYFSGNRVPTLPETQAVAAVFGLSLSQLIAQAESRQWHSRRAVVDTGEVPHRAKSHDSG